MPEETSDDEFLKVLLSYGHSYMKIGHSLNLQAEVLKSQRRILSLVILYIMLFARVS